MCWSRRWATIPRPPVYKTGTLPAELRRPKIPVGTQRIYVLREMSLNFFQFFLELLVSVLHVFLASAHP